ncbi:MAG: hypothetical protein HC831_13125 [Chloroflexia bacterium]|nr:hypothetical protein [Chloroflexia bacterium]
MKDRLKNILNEGVEIGQAFKKNKSYQIISDSKGLTKLWDEKSNAYKIIELPKFINNSNIYSETKKQGGINVSPSHIYIDMIYDILKNNSYVTKMGFFRDIGVSDMTYKQRSKYYQFNNTQRYGNSLEIYNGINSIRDEIENRISICFKYYNFLIETSKRLKDGITLESAINELDTTKTSLSKHIDSCLMVLTNYVPSTSGSSQLSEYEKNTIENLHEILIELKKRKKDISKEVNVYLENTLMPELITLNINHGGKYNKVIQNIDSISKKLINLSYKDLLTEDSNLQKYLDLFTSSYSEILFIINNLDNVESYDKILVF